MQVLETLHWEGSPVFSLFATSKNKAFLLPQKKKLKNKIKCAFVVKRTEYVKSESFVENLLCLAIYILLCEIKRLDS